MKAKRFAALSAAFMILFSVFLSPLPAKGKRSYAAETNFENTNVLADLQSIEGFSLAQYPYYESAKPEMRIIDFVEYCYDYRDNMRDNYGLYCYVYNPNGQNIVTDSEKNKVQIAVAYDSDPITEKSNALTYEKFDLQFCSVSEGAGVNKLFYKFKVVDHESADGKTIAERVNSMDRRYDISGIELFTEGNSNATEYGVATSYHFTGFAVGYGEGGEGTTLTRKSLETISLDLRSTTYRFPYINQNGAGHQNQLDSVYFAIPKEFNENYGDLYRVKCCWDEQKTSPVIVTNRQEIYEEVAARLNTDGRGAKYGIFDNFTIDDMGGAGGIHSAQWAFNKYVGGGEFPSVIADDTPYVGYVFKSDKSNIKDTEISSSQMKEWINKHNKEDYLFSDRVDEGRTKGYQEHIFTADEPFDMLTFNQSASGWDKYYLNWQMFWSGKKWDFGPEQQDPVEPICYVKDENFTGTDVVDANNLYVNPEDFKDFASFYEANKATKNVFLLRFAVTDYYSNMADVWDGGFFSARDVESTYIARETVFLDFDIIQLTFLRNTTKTIIPVVASPIDVVGGITAPIENDVFPWWAWLLIGIAVILVVIFILPKLVFLVVKIVVWIVMLPFKFVGWLIEKIRGVD